jgi:hypothetical protein
MCEALTMTCPLCHERSAKRLCPAVGRRICAVCCGTKRQAEIACPPDCGYLSSAHAHPPALVRRQQEQDIGFVMAMREGLSNRESELYWAVLTFLAGFRSDPLLTVQDDDLAEGAGSLAATYETANRGVIYEHRPRSLVAQRLVTDLKAFLASLVAEADAATMRAVERDAAVVLRRIERGAVQARKTIPDGPATALGMIGRVVAAAGRQQAPPADAPRIEPPAPMLIKP